MDKELVKKLSEKEEYYKYLKENSEWVKELKRNPKRWNDFVKYIKEKYKLRTTDKINDALDNIGMLSEVLSGIK